VYLFPPYFDRDAFMHHPMHVLDASDYVPKWLERNLVTLFAARASSIGLSCRREFFVTSLH